MIDARRPLTIDDARSAVSIKAIAAGATASVALSLVLVAFGAGVGFSVVSPWADRGVSATTFSISAGVYLIVVAMLASTVGGYIAGRLRTQWRSVDANERYFRDSAHGFLVWALATVVSAVLLGSAFTHVLSGASAGLAPAAVSGAPAQGSPADIYIDALLRTDPMPGTPAEKTNQATLPVTQDQQPAPLQGGQIAPTPPAPREAPGPVGVDRGEIARILMPALTRGGIVSEIDRTYLLRLVSARTGLPSDEAGKRVSQVITQATAAADQARSAAAKFALWLAASMLAGALAASLAAIEGGNLRNREWYLTADSRRRAAAE